MPIESDRQHSELGASNASRWMNCPGSVHATRGVPSTDSVYAAEGTAAHTLAQLCLTEGHDADHYIGRMLGTFEVTPVMAGFVEVYVDTCRRLMDACDIHHIEQTCSLELVDPPTAMYGTADFIACSTRRRELHVVDLKYGKGQWVPARDNPQLYYALGAVLTVGQPISRVTVTIVQPRTKGDVVRSATLDAIELAEWSFSLLDHARAALAPGAPVVAGDWCKFCPVRNSCVAHQDLKGGAAYHEFSFADATNLVSSMWNHRSPKAGAT